MESSELAEASEAMMRPPVSEGISGYLAPRTVYLEMFFLGTNTLEMKKKNLNSWSTSSLKGYHWVSLADFLVSYPSYLKWASANQIILL